MKNYTQPAKKILEAKILSLVYEVSPELKITHKSVKFDKSECEINVRKGKPILVYDFELDIEVVGEHSEEDNSNGSYKVREILSDDLNDMVVDDVRATEKNKTADLIKKWLKKNAKAGIIEVFKHLEEELMKQEADPNKIEEDRKKREENQLATKKAKEEKGAEKERLLEEQRLKERRLKEEAMAKNFEEAIKKNDQ